MAKRAKASKTRKPDAPQVREEIEGRGTRFRSASFEIVRACGEDGAEEKRTVRASVSSETPVEECVFDDAQGEWVRAMEVLGHGEGEIDKSRMADGLVIQDTKYSSTSGLSPRGHLERQAEFHASTHDEA